MKPEDVEQHWDACRDGELTDADRRAFDKHMLSDREAASLWGAETRWLTEIGRKDVPQQQAGDASFVEQVLERYDRERRGGVLAKLQWRSAANAIAWVAAAVVLGAVIWITQPRSPGNPHMARTQNVSQPSPDAVTILVDDMTEQVRMRPAHVYNAVRDTQSMLTMERALQMLGMDMSEPNEPMPGRRRR